jgi:hypothetical protein
MHTKRSLALFFIPPFYFFNMLFILNATNDLLGILNCFPYYYDNAPYKTNNKRKGYDLI